MHEDYGLKNKTWTELEEEKLLEYWDDDYTDEEIGELLKRSAFAISVRRRKLGLPAGRSHPYNQKVTVYLLEFPDYKNLYKIGLSKHVLKRRGELGVDSEVVILRECKNIIAARKLEIEWLNNIKHLLRNTNILVSGNTETFIYES